MSAELGLIRLGKEGRAQLGVTGGLFQLKKSLACLRLLRARSRAVSPVPVLATASITHSSARNSTTAEEAEFLKGPGSSF